MVYKIYSETIVRDYNFKFKKDAEAFKERLYKLKNYRAIVLYLGTDYINGGWRVSVEMTRRGLYTTSKVG